jgi:ABC-type uncharacterized transport system auxiliary subunit
MSNPTVILRCAFSLLAVLALSGCISLPGADKNKTRASIYTLHPSPAAKQPSSAADTAPVVVFVPRPELPKGFDTERITLLFEQSHRLDYYADAKWSARLDDLLQDFIVQMVRHVLPAPIAATTDATAAAHHKLAVKITAFQPVYQLTADSPPRLDAAMTVTLFARPGETVEAQFSLQKSAPASANTMSAVTKELELLLRSLTEEMLQKIAPSMFKSNEPKEKEVGESNTRERKPNLNHSRTAKPTS